MQRKSNAFFFFLVKDYNTEADSIIRAIMYGRYHCVQMRENVDQNNSEYGHFHALYVCTLKIGNYSITTNLF